MGKKNSNLPAIIVMFALFFIIAFVTNLAGSMGVVVTNQFGASKALSQLGTLANFIAYACMGIPAGIILKRKGYKFTSLLAVIVGLVGVGVQFLSGYVESFDLPVKLLAAAVNNQPAKYLVDNDVAQCPIRLAASAQKMIHNLNQLERSALCKALRDNWYWRYPEDLTLYADWNDSFYFHSETICGGLCRHLPLRHYAGIIYKSCFRHKLNLHK